MEHPFKITIETEAGFMMEGEFSTEDRMVNFLRHAGGGGALDEQEIQVMLTSDIPRVTKGPFTFTNVSKHSYDEIMERANQKLPES